MVLDDGECLEGFPEPDAVGDDAPAEPVELVDGSHDTIALELEELLPYRRVSDPRGRLDDLLLVQFVALGTEQVVQYQRIDTERIAVGCK